MLLGAGLGNTSMRDVYVPRLDELSGALFKIGLIDVSAQVIIGSFELITQLLFSSKSGQIFHSNATFDIRAASGSAQRSAISRST